ncbi:hypothetical protein AB7W40_19655 [Providencia rettgeri]
MTKIFKVPFATQGDRTSIPDELQADGSVSYTQGYGYDYERDQASDPAAKDIARDVMNGMFHDITEAVGELQGFGFPQWATEGKPYPVRSVVYHKEKVWQSTIANNNDEPALNNSWRELKADITAGDIDAYTKAETDTKVADAKKAGTDAQNTANNANTAATNANNNANSRVPSTRKVNNKALSTDISLNAGDIGAYTKAEVDSKLQSAGVTSVRLGASVSVSRNINFTLSSGEVLVGLTFWDTGSNSAVNFGGYRKRTVQYYLNGAWVNAASV